MGMSDFVIGQRVQVDGFTEYCGCTTHFGHIMAIGKPIDLLDKYVNYPGISIKIFRPGEHCQHFVHSYEMWVDEYVRAVD